MSDTGLPDIPPPGAPKEPLLKVGTITVFVTAVVGLAAAFGLRLSHEQMEAILAVAAVVAPFIVAVIGRLKVWSPRTVRQLVQQVRAEERGKHAARTTAEADIRDLKPGWLPPGLTQ